MIITKSPMYLYGPTCGRSFGTWYPTTRKEVNCAHCGRLAKNRGRGLCSACFTLAYRSEQLPGYRQKELQRTWTPEGKQRRRDAHLKSTYGLSAGSEQRMLQAQNNRCAIVGCRKEFTAALRPCVDHDHKTGQVRGLLCVSCNFGLGYMQDNPEIMQGAIEYLRKASANGGE